MGFCFAFFPNFDSTFYIMLNFASLSPLIELILFWIGAWHPSTTRLWKVGWYNWADRFIKTTRYITSENSASWSELYFVGMYSNHCLLLSQDCLWGEYGHFYLHSVWYLFSLECWITKMEQYCNQESRSSLKWSCSGWYFTCWSRGNTCTSNCYLIILLIYVLSSIFYPESLCIVSIHIGAFVLPWEFFFFWHIRFAYFNQLCLCSILRMVTP